MTTRTSILLAIALTIGTSGCINLDGFVFNGRHCSTTGPDAPSCSIGDENDWDDICATCDDPYEFSRSYDWIEGTLEPGQTVRAIDESTVVRRMVPTEDGLGELDTYFIPSHGENAELANTTVMYNHGNFASIEHYVPRLQFLHELGFNILVWDYRGYGKSMPETHPTGEQFTTDARTMRGIVDEFAPDPSKIVIYAYSLGAIPAIEATVHKAPCALMLEAPFTSLDIIMTSVTTTSIDGEFLSQGYYDNATKLEGVETPILTMTGEFDEKWTPDEVKELSDATSGPKEHWVVPGAMHGVSNGGVPEAGLTQYFDKMTTFMREKAPGCLTP